MCHHNDCRANQGLYRPVIGVYGAGSQGVLIKNQFERVGSLPFAHVLEILQLPPKNLVVIEPRFRVRGGKGHVVCPRRTRGPHARQILQTNVWKPSRVIAA